MARAETFTKPMLKMLKRMMPPAKRPPKRPPVTAMPITPTRKMVALVQGQMQSEP